MSMDKKLFNCNVELALDIIRGKWKPLIICQIGANENIRYGELKRKIPNINERVLTRQLRELEDNKIIERKTYEGAVLKVEYYLTDTGKSLTPTLLELGQWGKQYNEKFQYGEVNLKQIG